MNRHIENHLVPLVSDAARWSAQKQSQLDAMLDATADFAGATWSVMRFLHQRLELAAHGVQLSAAP